MKNFDIKIEDGEVWVAGGVTDGRFMPIDANAVLRLDYSKSNHYNQTSTALLFSHGRVAYLEKLDINVQDGKISCYYDKFEPVLNVVGKTLKCAVDYFADNYCVKGDGIPPAELFVKPQFNDWMTVGYNQNQKDVLAIAKKIKEYGLDCSVFMIDDKWSRYYGDFSFDLGRFPDPKAMFDELHALGYKVMLWETPFVSPDSSEFRELEAKGLLVKAADGEVYLARWWNGYSAVIDLTKRESLKWFEEKNAELIKLGADGFKFDAGDLEYYPSGVDITPVEACTAYSEFASRYDYAELRASYNFGGKRVCQREADKHHKWEGVGLESVISDMLVQQAFGYRFTCPDMVGGGCIGTANAFDEELFVRFLQASVFMPMIQFSLAFWDKLSADTLDICKRFIALRAQFSEKIYSEVKKAVEGNLPVMKYLAYEYPDEGFEKITDCYIYGEDILVCPVLKKGQIEKNVRLPSGKWKYFDGEIYEGGKSYTFETPLDVLPYFIKA